MHGRTSRFAGARPHEVMVRRLALGVAPAPGESFASWIDRLGADMALPPGRVADVIGLGREARANDGTPLLFGVSLPPSAALAVQKATNVSVARLVAMQLSVFDGTVLDLAGWDTHAGLARVKRKQWALFLRSRACPACLAQSGGVWQLWWRLGVAVACPVHKTLLADVCPSCGVALRRGTAATARVLSRTLLIPPLTCGNRTDWPRSPAGCRQQVDAIETQPAPGWLVDLQIAYLNAARGAQMTFGDHRLPPAEWFQCLRAVIAMTRATASYLTLPGRSGLPAIARDAWGADVAASWRRSVGQESARSLPRSAALMAALSVFAAPVVLARGDAELADAIRPVAEAIAVARAERRQHGDSNSPLRGVRVPPLVEQARMRAVPYRVGVVAHLAPFTSSSAYHPPRLGFQHIPQVVCAEDYQDLLAVFLPGTLPRTGRRYAALALARLCGATSWPDAVSALGIPPERARALGGFASFRIADPQAFLRAVAVLAERLEQRGPVDYTARRAALDHLVILPPEAWRRLCGQARVVATWPRARHAAAWLWTELTGGYWEEAPALQEARWPARPLGWARLYRTFARTIPAVLAGSLRGWGTDVLAEAGIR